MGHLTKMELVMGRKTPHMTKLEKRIQSQCLRVTTVMYGYSSKDRGHSLFMVTHVLSQPNVKCDNDDCDNGLVTDGWEGWLCGVCMGAGRLPKLRPGPDWYDK